MMVSLQPEFVRARSIVLAALWGLLGLSPCFSQTEDVSTLVQQLKSPNAFARLAAAGSVAELGPSAAAASSALIEAFKCEQIDVLFESPQIAASRQRFADALIRIGKPIVPELEQALENESGLVRVWSAYSLYKIDRERHLTRVVAVLIDALRQDDEVAGDSAMILEMLRDDAVPAIPALIEQLGHREIAVRCSVAQALAAVTKGDETRRLALALKHANPLVRVGAAFALTRTGRQLPGEIQEQIAAALQDDSSEVRRQAVWAIGQIGAAAQPLAQNLINALPKLNPNVSEYFFGGGALGRQSTDPAIVLVATGPDTKPALIDALASDNLKTRVLAAVALQRLDRNEAHRTAPVLEAARADADQSLRFLIEMNSAPTVPSPSQDLDGLIQQVLQTNGFGPPSPAVGQLARRGADAVGPLIDVMKRGDGLAAARVGGVLAMIGAPAVPALTEAMHSDSDQLRVFAVSALAGMGKPAVPVLIEALQDDLYPVRRIARNALRSIGTPESREALRKLDGNQERSH